MLGLPVLGLPREFRPPVTPRTKRCTLAERIGRVENLRETIARWEAELDALGGRPRPRRGRHWRFEQARMRPWFETDNAIRGAKQLLVELEAELHLDSEFTGWGAA